jgi:hypothetical protein
MSKPTRFPAPVVVACGYSSTTEFEDSPPPDDAEKMVVSRGRSSRV